MKVSVIGAAGHVGLPLSLVLAENGHEVTCVDKDEELLNEIKRGNMPYKEPGAKKILKDSLRTDLLKFSEGIEDVQKSDVVVIVVGTPIDEHHNPEMGNLLSLIQNLKEYLDENHILILRSTVYPGTTALVKQKLEKSGFKVGKDILLSYAPERVAQHHALDEIVNLPQLIGTFEENSYIETKEFFETFLEAETLKMNPIEAELGKLFTNMYRYINFAIANEFYLIADSFAKQYDLNIHKILDKTKYKYPRFGVPSPGANVGGPCLTKDGWFLVDNFPFNELVSASFQINEGMPAQIINRMHEMKPSPDKITILGMTFKKDSDDIRNSISFKMRRQLKMKGYQNIVEIEPNLPGFDEWKSMKNSDWVILMTPHSDFENLDKITSIIGNPDCLFADIWGLWEEMKYKSDNSYFFGREVKK